MECFSHQDRAAAGLCKACYKAVCRSCAIELPNGLACTDACAQEVAEVNQIIERSKKIYGIGRHKSRLPSSGVLLWTVFAVVMWGLFLVPYFVADKLLYENLAMAILFSLAAGLAYYSARRTGVQC
ncbi:MAG: hypothetical protein OEY75_02550 [Hylemonella sp.]|nr:hypothetical protein [Hylemonella sp.]MDH5707969.1 hypothetical protein [Hylemonella sp.]